MWKPLLAGAVALALGATACAGGGVARRSLAVRVEKPPPPPRDAVVFGGESGSRAVALAVAPRRLVASVLAPDGAPLSGLRVRFAVGGRVLAARSCGPGCYSARARRGTRVVLRLSGSRPVVFNVPPRTAPAAPIVARAARVTRKLKTLVYLESLRSGPKGARLLTAWSLRAPDEVEYRIRNGASAVILGERRWDRDRPGAPWRRSEQVPALRVPQPAWGSRATNAHVLGTSRVGARPVWVVSFANPSTPAWFTAWIDRRTYRPLRLRMVAGAHFMTHRYLEFDRPLQIRPPR